MCNYCETAYDRNDSGREFGKLFEKTLDYTGEIQLSWNKENGMKTAYELYMNDDTTCTDLSVPIDFCPKCGRNLNSQNDEFCRSINCGDHILCKECKLED